MPEWWIERGIGETRFALIEGGAIVEARIELDGVAPAGTLLEARLASTGRNDRNAVATDDAGSEYLLPGGAPGATEGAAVRIQVTRSAIPGSEPWKRPLARVAAGADTEPVAPGGRELAFPAPRDELAGAGWNELIEEARTGIVRFPGGESSIEVTRAMTVIDVDGHLPPHELAVAGAGGAARAVRRLGIGGSIGIDLPTTGRKEARQFAAQAIDDHLPLPFERTAVNGFGFVQIVRPRKRASLIELAQDRPSFEARALLRRAAFDRAGPQRLVAHPAVIAVLEGRADWREALARQVGGAIGLRADPSLPMSGGYAEPA